MTDHVLDTLAAWDRTGDLPDDVALHLDACPACRAAFDTTFAPAPTPPVPPGRGAVALRRVLAPPRRPIARWGVAGFVLAAGLLVAVLRAAAPPPPRVADPWPAYVDANTRLDGPAALAAATDYLHASPTGAHAAAAQAAVERLSPVGQPLSLAGTRWLAGSPVASSDWIGLLWQVWCRFCLPALRRFEGRSFGVPVAALTTETRETPDDAVRSAVADLHLPVGVPQASSVYDTKVWPTAVLVCGGTVRWAGAPELVTPAAVALACPRAGVSPGSAAPR